MIVLVGPTASGKTDLAVALASALQGEIVSADSRQVYRLLDAGTAKPSAAQRERAKHWLLDCADPTETFDAARWAKEAAVIIAAIRARGRIPIVCGGTGLYVRALLEGLSPLPPRNEAVRSRLAAQAESIGKAALHARLAAADPAAAAGIPPENIQRVTRALEVLELTGRPISEHWSKGRSAGLSADLILRLDMTAAASRERIEKRALSLWPGLLAEIRALVPARFIGDEPGFTSLGYREALACAQGKLSEGEGLAGMIRSTVAYAKRQRTWFRNQLSSTPLDTGLDASSLLSCALRAWEEAREKTAA